MTPTIQETIAVVGVLSAFLTALVSLIGMRWNKQALDAKDAQMASLKQQVDSIKDRTPAELHKQVVALKELMEAEVAHLQKSLDESNVLLRRKSAEVSDEKRTIAGMLGVGRLFFGIDDGELLIRRLHGLLYTHGSRINYGEQELAIWSFYVNATWLIMPNDEGCAAIVSGNPEWMLDYLILPLLASMRFRSLRKPARELLERVCGAMEATPFSNEVPIYREAIEQAEGGFDFSSGDLPTTLALKLHCQKQW